MVSAGLMDLNKLEETLAWRATYHTENTLVFQSNRTGAQLMCSKRAMQRALLVGSLRYWQQARKTGLALVAVQRPTYSIPSVAVVPTSPEVYLTSTPSEHDSAQPITQRRRKPLQLPVG